MGKSKQNKTQKKDGNHRAETKEQRIERLRQQEEARQACFKIMPYVGGGIVLFLILFASYVRSVPPKVPKPKQTDAQRMMFENAMTDAKITPEFMKGADIKMKTQEVPPAEPPAEEEEPASEPNEDHVEL